MISLFNRRDGQKILDLEDHGIVKKQCLDYEIIENLENEAIDDDIMRRLENEAITERVDHGQIIGVLPGNKLLTLGNHLCIFDLKDGKLLHYVDDNCIVEHKLLPSKNLYVKCGIYDQYSTQEWSYFFNTATYDSVDISSTNDAFIEFYLQEPFIITWRLLKWDERSDDSEEQEADDWEDEEPNSSKKSIYLTVHDSLSGNLVCKRELVYGPCVDELGFEDGFDPIEYYGEDALLCEHDWTEQDIHKYKEAEYWSGFNPQLIEPRILGACYNPNWIILWNEFYFQVYDNNGESSYEYHLDSIVSLWPLDDRKVAILAKSTIIEFDLDIRQEISTVALESAPQLRPDLFLSFVKSKSWLTTLNNSIITGDVGKAQLWPDIFTDSLPIEWYSAYKPASYWFETNERIRVENKDHKRSETIELWYGNRKISLEEASAALKQAI